MATNGSHKSKPAAAPSRRDPAPTGAPSASGADVASHKILYDGLTFDDVLLLPRASNVMPADADTSTRLTPTIRLKIPLVSAPMDTVTESALAIALAQEGGIGIIHRNLPIEAQAREVSKVKRSANGVIVDPITLGPTDTVGRARQLMREHHLSGFPVTHDGGGDNLRTRGKVVGILTRRDLKFVENENTPVQEVMTREGLVTAPPGTTLEEAERIINKNKVEKLLLVNRDGTLAGLITQRDIDRLGQFPKANTDARGRLRCGAACGVDQYERVEAVLAAEADVIIIDTSHGHSENVLRTIRTIKQKWGKHGVEVIAGNIATPEAARALVEAGADAVKAGIGPGSICTTRIVTGVGVPQLTAIFNAVAGVRASGRDIPVIADGGMRTSGDIAKALAAGASACMLGSLFAGLDESPGELVISQGRRYKSYRGMGSAGAMEAGSADRYGQHKGAPGASADDDARKRKFVPEGVEGLVPYRGPLAEFVYQMVGGLRASMGYCGCANIDDFRDLTRFVRITAATVVENHPHDIRITKESPNYTFDVASASSR
ncbi:MAG: IMP dehydrogenase [Phycisphaerales bacterium]|nr:IMP dehydrogenase [Phycisphaerales bacterium]